MASVRDMYKTSYEGANDSGVCVSAYMLVAVLSIWVN